MHCEPHIIVRPARGLSETIYKNGDTSDIIRVILRADKEATGFITDDVECLRGDTHRETLQNVYKFVKGNIRYKADVPGLEQVKSPGALFKSRVGDCKSFSIAIAALCRALGYRNISYRFTSYGPGDYTHVYPVVKVGNETYLMDAVPNTAFNKEAPYTRKKDMPAHKAGMNGHPYQNAHIQGSISNFLTIAGVAIGVYLIYNATK